MEIWKDIEGFEDLYQVSNLGRVKSLISNKILKPRPDKKGYLRVRIYKDGNGREFSLHRLVAITFIPNPDNLPQVDHRDNDKTNNCVTNLQWITNVENNRKKETGWGQPKRVQCIETGEIYESVNAAAKAVNRNSHSMSDHLRGKTQTCAGKHFKYYKGDGINEY